MRSLFSLLALLLSFAVAGPVLAQIEEDTTHWNDEELYEDDAVEAPTYFAVAGGPMVGLFMPNLDAFNKNIARPFVGQDVSNSVIMVGGQGFISVPWIKNLRVGGLGYGGRTEQCCFDTVVDGTSVSRTLEYNIGYGGVSIDYVLPLNIKSFWIVPSLTLGLGSVELFAQQAVQRSRFDIEAEFGPTQSKNITHTYHSNFFLYMPQIQFEYSPIGVMMIRLSAGYQGTAMGKWEVDRGVGLGTTTGLDDINGNGLIFNLGVFFGLFPS
jgi:hypothetical protein